MTSKKTSSPPKQFNFSPISLHFMNLPLWLLPMMFLACLVPLPPRVSLARCDLPVSNEANEVSELRSRLESPPKSSKADSELWKSRPGHLSLAMPGFDTSASWATEVQAKLARYFPIWYFPVWYLVSPNFLIWYFEDKLHKGQNKTQDSVYLFCHVHEQPNLFIISLTKSG